MNFPDVKTICFTIDVEPDFGGLLTNHEYDCIHNLHKLDDIRKKYDLKLTAFVTGKTIEDNPDTIEILNSMPAEIEQHSYSHKVGHGTKLGDIQNGIETHRRTLGKDPLGYRAPQGIISRAEIHLLEDMGVLFDSSIFPTYFPGRFNRLKFPTMPFKIKGSNLVEIPNGVIPKIRIPINLSYMQLLGLDTFKFFFQLFGLPKFIVYGFHLHDLGKTNSYSRLPKIPKLEYYRAQRMYDDPIEVFEGFIKYALSKGLKSKYLVEVYREIEVKAPIWDWERD